MQDKAIWEWKSWHNPWCWSTNWPKNQSKTAVPFSSKKSNLERCWLCCNIPLMSQARKCLHSVNSARWHKAISTESTIISTGWWDLDLNVFMFAAQFVDDWVTDASNPSGVLGAVHSSTNYSIPSKAPRAREPTLEYPQTSKWLVQSNPAGRDSMVSDDSPPEAGRWSPPQALVRTGEFEQPGWAGSIGHGARPWQKSWPSLFCPWLWHTTRGECFDDEMGWLTLWKLFGPKSERKIGASRVL